MDTFSAFSLLLSVPLQGATTLIFMLLLLCFFSFIISGAEVAFFSLNHKDINYLKTKTETSYRRIVDLLETPKILLGSLLIANSFINIIIIVISNLLLEQWVHFLPHLFILEFLIKVVLVACVLLLVCEVMPKVMASQNNVRFAKDVAPFIEIINYIFKKLSTWLVSYSDIIEKKLSKKTAGAISSDEMSHAIDIAYETESEKNILKGILKFNTITAKQVMRARPSVHGIDYNANFKQVCKSIEELHYSRLPVFKDDLDEIAGLIHTKDLVPYINEEENFDWHQLIRTPYFIHEQKLIEDLLQEFQAKRIHFAVVVDEFGGTSGIVTLEDIMEEVIGEIKDEFDEEETSFKKIDDNNYLFEGNTMINDVCKVMELPLDTFNAVKDESDSLAGLVLEIAGEIPKLNDPIPCGDFEFKVLEIAKNRLHKIQVTIK